MNLGLGLGIGTVADGLTDFHHAGGFSQSQLLGHIVNGGNACTAAYLIEIVVAGYRQGFHHIDDAVGGAGIGVDQTFGLIRFKIGVFTQVVDFIEPADTGTVNGGDGGDHLKGGAGGHGGLQRPVVVGLVWGPR